MADNDRGLSVAFNVGTYLAAPTNRSLFTAENVGVEDNDVLARALFDSYNIGIELMDVLARAQYAALAVTENSGEADGLEVLLVSGDLATIERILRGK